MDTSITLLSDRVPRCVVYIPARVQSARGRDCVGGGVIDSAFRQTPGGALIPPHPTNMAAPFREHMCFPRGFCSSSTCVPAKSGLQKAQKLDNPFELVFCIKKSAFFIHFIFVHKIVCLEIFGQNITISLDSFSTKRSLQTYTFFP